MHESSSLVTFGFLIGLCTMQGFYPFVPSADAEIHMLEADNAPRASPSRPTLSANQSLDKAHSDGAQGKLQAPV